MRTTRAVGATATLLAVLAASGCGGSSGDAASSASTHTTRAGIASGEPAPPQTSTSTSPSSTTTSPPTKPTPSSNGTAAGAPGVPEAARQHTKAGAKAFVAHYLDVMNEVSQRPDPGKLRALSASGCKTCHEWIKAIEDQVANKTYYDSPIFKRPTEVRVLEVTETKYHLFFTLRQHPSNLRSRSTGEVVSASKAQQTSLVFETSWTTGGWRMAEVQKDA